jgi:hypothetical protein
MKGICKMPKPVNGQLMMFYDTLVRVQGSHVLLNGQVGYDLIAPSPGGERYGAAVEEELKPLTGTLPSLLPYVGPGHYVYYLVGNLAVYCDAVGSYKMLLFPPAVSQATFYPASNTDDLVVMVGDCALSPRWELR